MYIQLKNDKNHKVKTGSEAFGFNSPHNKDVHTCWPALETAPSETDKP